ncbi:MAG: NAD(P)/FAD-dependent oxidoreductase [Terriglobales bacterium]
MNVYHIAVLGGGPAGTAAAITAARQGARVLLLERSPVPRHKVCGEFVSAESLGLLCALLGSTSGAALLADAPRMNRVRIFFDGAMMQAPLPAPAASIERYSLDLALWRAAESAGVDARQQTAANKLTREDRNWRVETSAGDFLSRSVIDASGRWSNLRASPAPAEFSVGVKAHLASDIAEPDTVDLYFFRGGYCGVSRVNRDEVNLCAMLSSAELRSSHDQPLQRILAAHPDLQQRSAHWRRTSEVVITSPLVFRAVAPAENAVLRAGDAAGFIDPFAGDGISLALRSGTLAAQCLREVWQDGCDVDLAAREYSAAYRQQFAKLFRRTALLRRAIATPLVLHAVRSGILRESMLNFLIKATRAR